MNISEFAEQVVFGTRLEDKLQPPGKLTLDTHLRNRPNVDSLAAPGRPRHLKMQPSGSTKLQPPSDSKLENEYARGQLLHFLANHELLATELMALVLLKFPDAPPAFRQGVLVTLQEEQEHTRMYINRMRQCGVEFGSFPVSGQFWRVIEPMQSPMDFVSQLSLTFEQANLDYSLHFASVFRQIGDTDTADILQKIYQDEISHVKHGLHWFRQWKNPEHTDWEAYQAALQFPMSPNRGRGPRGAFNRDGRVQAGLNEDFIDAIEVFRQSRGRPPTVRWFDAGAESEVAGEGSSKSIRLMQQLGQDLELVLVAIAKQDDVVLVRRLPSRETCKHLIDVGFDLPELVLLEDRGQLANRKIRNFCPWAWTPKNHQIASELLALAQEAPPPWQACNEPLFRKSWAASRLREWLKEPNNQAQDDLKIQTPSWFSASDCVGVAIKDRSDFDNALAKFSELGYQHVLFKTDLGASGRGQRRFECRRGLSSQDDAWLRWCFDRTTSQPAGVVEPELDRLVDLSFLWHIDAQSQSAKYLGWTRPLITPGRRYAGARLGTALSDCDPSLKRFLLANRSARIQTVAAWLQAQLEPELTSRNFSGYFGVDAFVYRDRNNQLKVKPIVELNPRMTMGHIALSLRKRLSSGAEAMFRIFPLPQWREIESRVTEIPFQKSTDGLWKSGVIRLGEPTENSKFVPVMLIGEEALNLVDDFLTPSES